MPSPPHDPGNQPANRSSRILLLILIGIIVAGIAAFLIFRPNPSNTPVSPSTTQH